MDANTIIALEVCKSIPEYDQHAHKETIIANLIAAILTTPSSPADLVTHIKVAEQRGNMDVVTLALAAVLIFRATNNSMMKIIVICPFQVVAEQLTHMTLRWLTSVEKSPGGFTKTSIRMGLTRLKFAYPRDLRPLAMSTGRHVLVLYNGECIDRKCIFDLVALLQETSRLVCISSLPRKESELIDVLSALEIKSAV